MTSRRPLGGLILLSLGIIGEYLGKIFNETKGRPAYFINSYNEKPKKEDICKCERNLS